MAVYTDLFQTSLTCRTLSPSTSTFFGRGGLGRVKLTYCSIKLLDPKAKVACSALSLRLEHNTRVQLPRRPGDHPVHDERSEDGVDHLPPLQQGREDGPAHGAGGLGDRGAGVPRGEPADPVQVRRGGALASRPRTGRWRRSLGV